MNVKIAIITAISVILYVYLLMCIGITGPHIQSIALCIGFYVLKYGLLLFGLVIAGFLPYRINTALEKRKQKLYEIESDKKITELAESKKRMNEKIMNEYIKNEDAI